MAEDEISAKGPVSPGNQNANLRGPAASVTGKVMPSVKYTGGPGSAEMGGTPMTSMTPMKSGNPSAAAQLGPMSLAALAGTRRREIEQAPVDRPPTVN